MLSPVINGPAQMPLPLRDPQRLADERERDAWTVANILTDQERAMRRERFQVALAAARLHRRLLKMWGGIGQRERLSRERFALIARRDDLTTRIEMLAQAREAAREGLE
jgi:hypothetical protein